MRRLLLLWGVGVRQEEKGIGGELGGCVDSFYWLIVDAGGGVVVRVRSRWIISGQAAGSCDVTIGSTDVEAETPVVWPPDANN